MICCSLHSNIKKTVPKTLLPEATEIIKEASAVIESNQADSLTECETFQHVCTKHIFFSSFLLCIALLKDEFAVLKSQNPIC